MQKNNLYMKYITTVLLSLLFTTVVYNQSEYEKSYFTLSECIRSNESVRFRDMVFIVESTFNPQLTRKDYIEKINFFLPIIHTREVLDSLLYQYPDKVKIKKYAAIFKTLTDTTRYLISGKHYENTPFRYDFEDIFGGKNWENMFVTKLLATRKGNCHSMPYLYKILCDEIGVPCHLPLAPNHIYIKHQSKKAGWYNTELTSASFPIDAWLMASGYITLQAIQNGIYMDALNNQQCIALCILDLAKGFDRKYPQNDGAFIVKCCDLTLEHFPKCINAMLFKAETRKKQLEQLMKTLNISNPAVLRLQPEGQKWWEEMNSLYTQIHRLGYRTMPEQMYVDWLLSLQKER
jgi:hypothetical protein